MIVTQPDYYDCFACIAGDCPDSCCIGWQVIPDQDHLDYYRTIEGPLGEEIRRGIVEIDGEPSFALCNGRCCMLREDGLCKIQYTLGEEALSKICGFYPRFITELGLIREQGLSISCPEVARMILTRRDPITFKTYQTDEPLRYYHDVEPERILAVRKGRDEAMAVLQDPTLSLAQTMKKIIYIGLDVDDVELEEPLSITPDIKMSPEDFCRLRARMYYLFISLERLRPRWTDILEQGHRGNALNSLDEDISWKQLLGYYLFKYSLRSAMDDNFLQWASLSVMSVILLQDLLYNQTGDMLDLVQLYAKETEHNDENIDVLMDALWDDPLFSPESIIMLLNRFL